ncbi:MAG TPA: TonB-dependent receptor [Candidatus Acidoferrum sp.]|nr:TonB-dependent receptor [Candidatus Acidoferrum sp.]
MNSNRRSPSVPATLFQSVLPVLLGLILASATIPVAVAQVDRAVLEGTVSDPSGRVIVGATLKVQAVDTGLTEEQPANSKGYYRFPGLAVGRYTVTVGGSGFRTKVIEDVILRVGQTRTLDVQLGVGAISEKVEVKATLAPEDRSSAEAATVIDSVQISELPNNGRDWASFTLLAPFAQDDGGGDQRTIRFAGRARDDNNFQIDGVDAGGIQEQAQKSQTRLQISQDAIEEYRVNSALYDAEYGTQAGGQIDVVTKSGTNDWHGGVFGYLRNSAFDARNFNDFDVNGNAYIPPFRYGQYGMTLGGPVKKDRLFFFINYEGLRQFGSTTNQVVVPNAAIEQATLSKSPQMCSILQAYAWRASTGSIGNCNPVHVYPDAAFAPSASDSDLLTAPATTTVHEDTWLLRMDYRINDKTMLYGSAHRDISLVSGTNGSGSLPYDLIQTINHPAGYYIALQNTFSPRLLNEAKVYINRSPFINPQVPPLPYSVSTNNWVTINNNQADHEIGTTYGIVDNLTLVHGRNTFKTGIEIRRVRLNQGLTAGNTLSFADNSSNADTGFVNASLYGISYTDTWCCHKLRRTFYMPYFQDEWKVTPTLTLNLGIRWEYYGVAHEADNRTTVFDVSQFHGVCFGSGSIWRFALPSPIPSPVNTPACPKNPPLYNPDYRNFDPRVSFAWAPEMFHGKTVIRSGFGIYHGAAQNDDLNAGLESDRYTAFANFDPAGNGTPLLPQYQQVNPDLSSLPIQPQQQPRALQRHGRRDLYAETWGLTVDRELPSNFLASAQYLGSRGVRLFSRGGVNFCSTAPQGTDAAGNPICTRPLDQFYPGGDPYGSVDYKSDIGSSTYNALLLSLQRRFSSGLSFQGRYTWSHSINDGSVGGGESNGPENVNCLSCDKGPSVFDVRNNVTVDAVYELPFGPGKSFLNGGGVLGKIVGGWQMSSIGLWHTGHPLTIMMNISPDQLPDGNDQTTQRPDLVPGVPIFLPGGVQNHTLPINPAAFAPPPLAAGGVADSSGNCVDTCGLVSRFGTAPNGLIRAVNTWQIDLALTKETKLTERVAMEFGAQVFNIFNHTQYGDPNGDNLTFNYTQATDNAGNPIPNSWILQPKGSLGLINTTVNFNNNNDNAASPNTGTGLPRQIQLMLRFKF